MSDNLKDLEMLKRANFTPNIQLVAAAAISSLQFLKELSAKLGIPIEQFTAEHIVQEFASVQGQIRENQKRFGS